MKTRAEIYREVYIALKEASDKLLTLVGDAEENLSEEEFPEAEVEQLTEVQVELDGLKDTLYEWRACIARGNPLRSRGDIRDTGADPSAYLLPGED